MHVIAQIALCLPIAGAAVTAAWAWWGITNPEPVEFVRPVHAKGNLRQHVGHDLSELGGLSQRHDWPLTSVSER